MPPEESVYPRDWFDKAQKDIRTVDILLREQGDAEVAGFHLQQAIEKYLKGFLLANGWSLKRIHDLVQALQQKDNSNNRASDNQPDDHAF